MVNDQLSDFLTRIRNAGLSRKARVDVLKTKMNTEVSKILLKEGYIKDHKDVQNEKNLPFIRIYLKYENSDIRKPVLQGLKRESRPGLRKYVNKSTMPRVLSGLGCAILSTSKGIMTEKSARRENVGGEYLCSVW